MVTYERNNRVAYITLNRPEKRNALNPEMVTLLNENLDKAALDNECKVVVLQSMGDAFCAGADLAYLQQLQQNSYDENLADSEHLMRMFKRIYQHPKMIIAKIQGHALAGGCGLATVCDYSIAVPEAKFGYTEVKIGFIPAIVKVFLIRKIGEGKAREILLTGQVFDALRALNLGLINEVVSADELDHRIQEFAEQICLQTSAQSIALTKEMIDEVQNKTLDEALNYAATMNAKARATVDCKKGIQSFLNKEPLSW
jgi:methylglutaconyl-CoA hydratase